MSSESRRNARRFAEIDLANPEIGQLFERFTLELIRRGFRRYSSDAVLHRVRWETAVALEDGQSHSFKINNIWTPYYARKFIQQHPEHAEFFILRSSHADSEFPGVRTKL